MNRSLLTWTRTHVTLYIILVLVLFGSGCARTASPTEGDMALPDAVQQVPGLDRSSSLPADHGAAERPDAQRPDAQSRDIKIPYMQTPDAQIPDAQRPPPDLCRTVPENIMCAPGTHSCEITADSGCPVLTCCPDTV